MSETIATAEVFYAPYQAMLEGVTVDCGYLVTLDLLNGPLRYWTGVGKFTVGGYQYIGAGNLCDISGLEQPVAGQAPETTFGFSGVSETLLNAFRDNFTAQAKGRKISVALQFIDAPKLKPLGPTFTLWTGEIGQPSIEIGEKGTRGISVSAESIFATRSQSILLMYTDADWKNRYPGDRGMEFVTALKNQTTTWPTF